ncbi:hypothetical protein AMAG_19400 [Allomyces macrogynus ATCC 38327]|uniref:Uncharacterized protein n=1 Tax=Allomyces macrogynus (strain ATCC 38327) TaxID=578462 RepID=A0A0L0SQU4_ALLM3|nr:hypothetical protein AMAG_19400 [Allomyces macrogynus ATCC 38327]|eukprot:KNE64913.1 hypothetical protein AMAG_19400 [Allomyces macrogynus ATCC 38327]
MTITPPAIPAPVPSSVLSPTTSPTSGLSTTSQPSSTVAATDPTAAPARSLTNASVQVALGTTFWVLTTEYLLVWLTTLAYNALSKHNRFLRMAVTTCLSTCWLIVEALFKLIVRARVRRSHRVHAVKARAAMASEKRAVKPAIQWILGSMGQLEVVEGESAAEKSRGGGMRWWNAVGKT